MQEKERRFYERKISRWIERLRSKVFAEEVRLKAQYLSGESPVPFAAAKNARLQPIEEGELWGSNFSSAWFRLVGSVLEEWKGKDVIARIDFGGEACIFDSEGTPLQGLTSASVYNRSFKRDRFDLFFPCEGGEYVELWIEAAASHLWGLHLEKDPDPADPHRLGHLESRVSTMRLAVFDTETWKLFLDAGTLFELMMALPEKSVRRARLLRCLDQAADAFADGRDGPDSSREFLQPELRRRASFSDLRTQAVRHGHIDTAWSWPIQEGIRKCVRTFVTQIRLIEKYPGYIFGGSQAQHYAFVKERYPALYKKIKKAVSEKRWEIQGAMWVEADTNIIGGESLIRQILHGKNFFEAEFGASNRILWLPDVFGYPASLPQILHKSEVDYFLTQKISWSQFNRFPHHTFLWQGIDGTKILTHFPPEDTYNSTLSPKG